MTKPRPIYCSYGDLGHPAEHTVDSRTGNPVRRHCVTCTRHLPQALRWAGTGSSSQPLDGHAPPPEQQALF